jgi:hypothetical protein
VKVILVAPSAPNINIPAVSSGLQVADHGPILSSWNSESVYSSEGRIPGLRIADAKCHTEKLIHVAECSRVKDTDWVIEAEPFGDGDSWSVSIGFDDLGHEHVPV